MNKLIIIGNLTRKPELGQTPDGVPVCNFTVAVNRRVKSGAHPEADYFRVAAWRALGESCATYLGKGPQGMRGWRCERARLQREGRHGARYDGRGSG